MKVIAKVGFSGPAVSMSVGQVGEIADKVVLADLLKAGYVEKVEEMPEEKNRERQKKRRKNRIRKLRRRKNRRRKRR